MYNQAMELKVYVAGKISKESVFGTHYWRDAFCTDLQKLIGETVINLDPTNSNLGVDLDQSESKLVFGRDCYLISQADVVIVNLTNDISVGGSQEMLIAKYFNKFLIGIAPTGGKFRPSTKELFGKTYHNYVDPFVASTCDVVVEDLPEAAKALKTMLYIKNSKVKTLKIIDDSINFYLKKTS